MPDRLKCLIPTIGCPATLNGREGRYELAAFYCELLGMEIVNEGWLLIAEAGGDNKLFLAFDGDGWEDQRPPRWPDPEYPQQLHLDVRVPDLASVAERMTGLGATLLRDNGDFRVYADPVGHPFCLFHDPAAANPRVARLVFDCFSPRLLASFYEGFLGAHRRVDDSPERVVVDLGDAKLPDLAFQHAQFRAARWPDPGYPAQLHVDYRWHDGIAARAALERAESLGAIRLPQLGGAEIYADPASHPFCIQNEIPMAFDIVGMYVNPPEYAVVYAVDKTVNVPPPTLSRPVRPLLTEPAKRPAHAGTVAALGAVGSEDRTTAFARFLTEMDSTVPEHLEVNLVCDWSGTYESPVIKGWLAGRPRFQVHRNPPDADWREQVDHWLAHLPRAADAWADGPKPFVWTKAADEIVRSLRRLA